MTDLFPLTITGLKVERDEEVLINVPSLTISSGERVALLGPNGAGKSLFLRAITALLGDDITNTVRWGKNPPAADVIRRCGVVMQQPLMLRRSVRDNIRFALKQHNRDNEAMVERALALSQLVNEAGRSARVLSGGERMRLAIARALVLNPDALLLDEPTASLDHSAARHVETLVSNACEDGKTLVLITHDLALARRLCSRIVLLHKGSVLIDTDTNTFFDRPPTAQVAAYVRGDYLE